MENYAIRCAEYIAKLVQEREEKDPKLVFLKRRVNEVTQKLELALEDDIPGVLQEQNLAIEELIKHVTDNQVKP